MNFQEATAQFLDATFESRAALATVELLQSSDKYAGESRNRSVEQLAKDVEAKIGAPASLMFRSQGVLHDALQNLMDAYVDSVDNKREE